MTYTLIVLNSQGASEQTSHDTKSAVRSAIRAWADPKNMTARVFEDGTQIYDGKALGFGRDNHPNRGAMRFEKTDFGWRAFKKEGDAYVYFGHFLTQREAREVARSS